MDARSDVFSFGAVLYELLSGRRAFAGDTPRATLSAVMHETPSPLETPAALKGSSSGVWPSSRAIALCPWWTWERLWNAHLEFFQAYPCLSGVRSVSQGTASRENVRARGTRPRPGTPIWGRVWYHLLCSEIDATAVWYQKMIEVRDIFAPIYANSPYTAELRASPYWPKLARMMKLPDSAP